MNTNGINKYIMLNARRRYGGKGGEGHHRVSILQSMRGGLSEKVTFETGRFEDDRSGKKQEG